jgi:hypothetical protein
VLFDLLFDVFRIHAQIPFECAADFMDSNKCCGRRREIVFVVGLKLGNRLQQAVCTHAA